MSERIRTGRSLARLWGGYVKGRIELEASRRRLIKRLSRRSYFLQEGQVSFIDKTDAVVEGLSRLDLGSAQSRREFGEFFSGGVPETRSLAVLHRRDESVLKKMEEGGVLMNDCRRHLVGMTVDFIKSLF